MAIHPYKFEVVNGNDEIARPISSRYFSHECGARAPCEAPSVKAKNDAPKVPGITGCCLTCAVVRFAMALVSILVPVQDRRNSNWLHRCDSVSLVIGSR